VAQPSAATLPDQVVGAVPSLVTEPCTATARNRALACGATGDFAVGQPIFVPLAAAPNTLNAGNGAGIGPTISAINFVRLPGGATGCGTRMPCTGSGSSKYCYAITTFNKELAESALGPTRCTGATEPAPLGGDQSEQPVWPIVAGATQYGLYRVVGGTLYQIGTYPQMTGFLVSGVPSTGGQDFGLPASTRTAPGSALNGVLYGNVTAIVPNVSITVSIAPSVSGSVTIGHENCGPINVALSADSPQGGTVQLPAGQYRCAKMLDIPSQTTLAGHCAYTEYPSGTVAPNYNYGSSLVWGGPDGVITAREWTGMNDHSECINYNANAMNLTAIAPVAIRQMVVGSDHAAGQGGNDFARVQGGAFYNGFVGLQVGGTIYAAGSLPSDDVSMSTFKDLVFYSSSPGYAIIDESTQGYQHYYDHVTTLGGIQGFTDEPMPNATIESSNLNCGSGGGNAIRHDSASTLTLRSTDIEGPCTEDFWTTPTIANEYPNGVALALLQNNTFYGTGNIKLDGPGLVISLGNTGISSGAWQPDSSTATVLTFGDSNPWIASVHGGSVISLKSIAQDLTLALNPNRVELDPSLDTVGRYGAAIDFMPWQVSNGWPFRIADEYTARGHQLAIIPAARGLADWQPNHSYSGATVTPKVDKADGLYLFAETGPCRSGTLASEPQWPLILHGTVTDNTCTWTNQGQIFPAGTGNGLVLSNTGLYQDGGAVKHGTVTTGSIEANSTATVTLNWTTAFPDTNYTPDCSVIDTGGNLTLIDINGWNAGSLTAAVKNNDSGNRHTGTLACHAFHN